MQREEDRGGMQMFETNSIQLEGLYEKCERYNADYKGVVAIAEQLAFTSCLSFSEACQIIEKALDGFVGEEVLNYAAHQLEALSRGRYKVPDRKQTNYKRKRADRRRRRC